jgi:16S rRNA (uracil1498-N3)-methyltransferase
VGAARASCRGSAPPLGSAGGVEFAAIAVRAAAAAQVFVEDPAQPVLSPEDAHHLGRVLRLRSGEEVIVSDGAGHWARTRWNGSEGKGGGAKGNRADLLVARRDGTGPGGDGSVQFDAAASPALTVTFAPTKGEKPEWVVQKLTELGIDRVVPLMSERSVVRWQGAKGRGAVERLRRVARDAAAQCRRVWLPVISDVVRFDELEELGEPGEVVLAQLSGDRPSPSQLVVAVGPEGGWSGAELASGLPTVGFGLSVLRAETAAVTAGALMVSLRTGTVAAVSPRAPVGESS